jgi:hypothetical protein
MLACGPEDRGSSLGVAKNVDNFIALSLFERRSCRPLTRDNSGNMDHPSDWPTISWFRARLELLMRQRVVVMIQLLSQTIVHL